MKDLKSVLEGILGDIDVTISKSDKTIDKYVMFGKRFKFTGCTFLTESTASILNASALKKLTHNLDYINDNIERGIFDKKNKFKMFLNWIDHMTFDELGVSPVDATSQEFRAALADAIENKCIKAGVFNNAAKTIIFCPSVKATGTDNIRLFLHRSDKINIGVNLTYEIL